MINLTKEESINKINLRKSTVIKLTKETPLENLTSRVALVLDYSGSMLNLYEDGVMQQVIERILPIAMKFDDNGELDFWIFNSDFHRLDGVTLDNFYGLTERLMEDYSMGGTIYGKVIEDIIKYYTIEEPMNIPSYVIFITDGDNSDKSKATNEIIEASKCPVFFQFVGIGGSSFDFLEKLDTMNGRYVDNANFFQIGDIDKIDDEELYKMLLAEYPQWLEYPEVKEMLEGNCKEKWTSSEERSTGRKLINLLKKIFS